MKYSTLISLFIAISMNFCQAQSTEFDIHQGDYIHELNPSEASALDLTNDPNFDVKFYHLDIEIAIDSSYIQGNVEYLIQSNIDGLDQILMDLDNAFTVDSVSLPAIGFDFSDNQLRVSFASDYTQGDLISFKVYYQGKPELAGGFKGLRYETHDGGEPIIATLSTPYLAHTWWPCKDGVSDKADSTFLDISIKDSIVNTLPLIAVSNGLLESVELEGNLKTFKWRHRYPCVPYYIMVAISNFDHFQHIIEGEEAVFPIDYYVFQSHLSDAQEGVINMPDIMNFFEQSFGPYPFGKEKYAMTQLGYYGGIENQTNSIVNSMGPNRLKLIVHELAHMWFADMITCDSWNHGWLNEGFASYAEALYDENANGFVSYQGYISGSEYYNAGTLYLSDVSDPFNVFRTILYSKGAYVLHMLRGVLGDESFFRAIKTYATNEDFKYQHATTENFQLICEEVSGKDLNYFFEQWIYDERYPIYNYNFNQDDISQELLLTIEQKQSGKGWREVFTMPMEIKVEFENGTDTLIQIINDSKIQNYTFSVSKKVENLVLDPNKWILKESLHNPTITVGNRDITRQLFNIFPNPSNGKVNIEFKDQANFTPIQVCIINLAGKELFSSNITRNTTLDLDHLSSGIYFLHMINSGEKYIQKLRIKKK